MKLDVYNIEGSKTGRTIDLPKDIFGLEPNEHAVYLTVKQHLANKRQGTHAAKERNAIKGSTRKIKRQKGTGTARAGDIKNPLFKGGGRVHGPRPHTYNLKVNKKVKKLAKFSALSDKAQNGRILVLEDFTFDNPGTKAYLGVLDSLELKNKRTLMVLGEYDNQILRSSHNVDKAEVAHAKDLNTYDIMKADTLIVHESGLKKIQEMYA